MKFTSAWANRCGKPLNTSICAGVINPARGRGAALTYANCVAGALADRRLADAGEFACILEDDARPFSTDWCDASEREAIVRQMPSEALLLLIGGHDMEAQPGYSRARSHQQHFPALQDSVGCPNSMDPNAFCYRGTDAPLVHNILRDVFHFGCTDPPCRKVDTKAAVSPEKMLLWHAERLGRTVWTNRAISYRARSQVVLKHMGPHAHGRGGNHIGQEAMGQVSARRVQDSRAGSHIQLEPDGLSAGTAKHHVSERHCAQPNRRHCLRRGQLHLQCQLEQTTLGFAHIRSG